MTLLRATACTAVLAVRTLVHGLSAAGDQWAVGLGCDRRCP